MPNSSWVETGTSIDIVPTSTTVTSTSAQQNSPDYLTNADKIALMAQYAQELATKTALDTTAAGLGVPTTNYDNAVAGINTTLVNAGAPASWATTWPDGTTFGPSTGIQTALANDWAGIATARTALQTAISATQASQQAAAAQAAAISTAVAEAVAAAPVQVASLPILPSADYPAGRIVWNTADGHLYISTGSAWTASTVAAADISGTLSAAQIASLAASQVTGQLTAAQIASITAAQLTGQITGTQISDGAISTAQLAAGAVTASTIAADTITAAQIAAGAITATQIEAGAITATQIAAGTIQAGNIAAATITGEQIAATTITAANIAADTITSAQIAAGAITASELAAGSVTTAALTANCVTAGNIAAGAITASMITSGTLDASQVNVTNLDASNITTGTMSASKVLFPDGSALTTANRVQTSQATCSSAQALSKTGLAAIPGLSWNVTASSANDVYNIFLNIITNTPNWDEIEIALVVDGNITSPAASRSYYIYTPNSANGQSEDLLFIASLTGLTAGSHTIAVYGYDSGAVGCTVYTTSMGLCQRIF